VFSEQTVVHGSRSPAAGPIPRCIRRAPECSSWRQVRDAARCAVNVVFRPAALWTPGPGKAARSELPDSNHRQRTVARRGSPTATVAGGGRHKPDECVAFGNVTLLNWLKSISAARGRTNGKKTIRAAPFLTLSNPASSLRLQVPAADDLFTNDLFGLAYMAR